MQVQFKAQGVGTQNPGFSLILNLVETTEYQVLKDTL